MNNLRIGEIPYLNCTPLFYYLKTAFKRPGYVFVKGHPAGLNSLLERGEIDVAPCSSIEYAFHPDKYLLVPNLSISAKGPIKSVLLFSHRPIMSLSGCRIALTSASASGATLLRIIFRKFLRIQPHFVFTHSVVSSIPRGDDAALVIGDNALKYKDRAPYVFDLGTLWHRYTGSYCVFSLWIVRREMQKKAPSILRNLYRDLISAKYRSRRGFDSLVKVAGKRWISGDELISYWRGISYDLTHPHITGLQTFYRLARETGVISSVPRLYFLRTGGKVL